MRTLQLHIISPEKSLYQGEVLKVLLPGTKAPFMVLPLHAPIISSLERGRIRFSPADGTPERTMKVSGGFVEVKNDIVTVCVE